jgi:hypothetical protein
MPFRSSSSFRAPAALSVPFRFRPGVVRGLLALVILIGFVGVALTPAGCERAGESDQAASGAVIVSIPPLEGLVAPVLGPDHAVRVLVPSGRSVHGYRPTPKDIAALGTAQAVVLVGLNLETGVARAARRVPVITMADALGIASEDEEDHSGHDHDGHDHAHGSVDPHLWLDPVLAARFVRALPGVLPPELVDGRGQTGRTPSGSRRRSTLIGEAYRRAACAVRGPTDRDAPRLVQPPRRAVWFAGRGGACARSRRSSPSAADIAKSVEAIRAEGVGAIFVEPQFGRSSADAGRGGGGRGTRHARPAGHGRLGRDRCAGIWTRSSAGWARRRPVPIKDASVPCALRMDGPAPTLMTTAFPSDRPRGRRLVRLRRRRAGARAGDARCARRRAAGHPGAQRGREVDAAADPAGPAEAHRGLGADSREVARGRPP